MDMNEVETVAGVVVLGHVANMTARYETELDVPVAVLLLCKLLDKSPKRLI